jgi:hypothetical protein
LRHSARPDREDPGKGKRQENGKVSEKSLGKQAGMLWWGSEGRAQATCDRKRERTRGSGRGHANLPGVKKDILVRVHARGRP